MSVVVVNHVSLDGVVQGPARPDEDHHRNAAGGPFRNGLDGATNELIRTSGRRG